MLAGDKRLVRVAIVVASIWVAIVAIATAGNPNYFGWQLLRAAMVVALLALIRRRPVAVVVIALTIADLWLATRGLVPRMPRAYFDAPPVVAQLPPKPARVFPEAYWQAFDQDPNAMTWIANRSGDSYWWLFRNALGDHLPARFGYELAMEDDVDRTALKTTDALLEEMKALRARHVIAAEQPFLKIAGVTARIRYTAARPAEVVPENYPRYAFADRVLRDAPIDVHRGMETIASADIEPFVPAHGEVREVRETANSARIAVRSAGRAFLVMSVTGHRYWSATLDGKPAPLILTNVVYQGIVIPAGDHVIETRYRNPMIAVGAVITILMLIYVGWVLNPSAARRAAAPRPRTG